MNRNIQAESGVWQPNWATHPGEHLAEYIEVNGWSQAEFARLAGLTPKLVSTILNKVNPVTPETAIRLERVLGVKAHIWTNLQASWDLSLAQSEETSKAEDAKDWLEQFPIKEIKARCGLTDKSEMREVLNCVLSLLGIGNPSALHSRMVSLAVHHRRAKNQDVSETHILTWLMLGERSAQQMDLPAFDASRFEKALKSIRKLTIKGPEEFEPVMRDECKNAGVALVFEKPIKKTCLFGSARWLTSDRAIIQMSLRMKYNDHFWWTFFHEAGHILLHRGKNFADDKGGTGDGIEDEADEFAEEILVGRKRLEQFVAIRPNSKSQICAFADHIEVHPGIIVGMLQHRGVIPYNHMNDLKAKFAWADEVDAC